MYIHRTLHEKTKCCFLQASSCSLSRRQTQKDMGENEARTLQWEAIKRSLQQPLQAQQLSETTRDLLRPVEAMRTWWNHVHDRFFLEDDELTFRDLRIDRNAFEDIVNTVADIPVQRRDRRAFVFSHENAFSFSARFSHLDFTLPTCSFQSSSPYRSQYGGNKD